MAYSNLVICKITKLWFMLLQQNLNKTMLLIYKLSPFEQHTKCDILPIESKPTLFIRAFATSSEENTDDNAFSWDTDGIPFVIDNSATGIICNIRKLFVCPLVPTQVTLETAEGLTTKTKFVGTLRLITTCDKNDNHSYDIPNSIYDPDSPINLIGIPFLGDYFG